MLKKLFGLALALLATLAVSAQVRVGEGQLSGSFESNSIYYQDDSGLGAAGTAPDDRFGSNNYMKLDYMNGRFSAGLQIDAYLPALQGYEIGQQPGAYHFYLSSKYIQWQDHNYSVRVGDIFDQFGSGLIFRSFEDRQLGFNNSIEGVQGIYRFGDYVEVPFDPQGFSAMAATTRELLDAATPVVCEATFACDGCLCMVDILLTEPDGVRLVEVKSSTCMSDIYLHDMAFQTWVLRRCGFNVKSAVLMHLNNQYVRRGELDLRQLFAVEDCTELVFAMQPEVGAAVERLKAMAEQPDEPPIACGAHCKKPYECGYCGWCELPTPNVFDLSRMQMKKGLELLDRGIVSFQDLLDHKVKLNGRQAVQVRCEVEGLDTVIDRKAVTGFLDGLSFPLYFLDFETFQPAVPPFDGVHPYQQIPTQYSLHVLREPGGGLEHYEFLAEAGTDPCRSVAEHLVADIPMGACTLAYNMTFEKGRISELAAAFPDLAEHLLAINAGMDDLLKPFSSGAYYARAMGGSNSIKRVLPALFPDDSELDYHSLDGVHNGSEAMAVYADLVNMASEEAARTRENLLRYCELDTYAMVKIWQKLVEAVEG